jgi:N-methylhydantoinase B
MVYYSPCGGGYGHPLERDPAKVLDDVLDGFCTPEDAREIYGVVLDLEEETVDLAATERLRLSLEEALARMPVAIS